MGALRSRANSLQVEFLEDRRLLSGFSALPLASLVSQPLAPAVAALTAPLALVPPLADVANLGEIDLGVAANISEGVALTAELEVALAPLVDFDLGVDVNIAGEVALAPLVEVDLGVDVKIAEEVALTTEVAIMLPPILDVEVESDVNIPDQIAPEGTIEQLAPGDSPPEENEVATNPEAPTGAGGEGQPSQAPASAQDGSGAEQASTPKTAAFLLDGRFYTNDVLRLLQATEETTPFADKNDAEADSEEGDVFTNELWLTQLAENELSQLLSEPMPEMPAPALEAHIEGMHAMAPPLAISETALMDQGEDLAAIAGEIEAFFADFIEGIDEFLNWLARIGPLPFVLIGLALAASGMEIANRYGRRLPPSGDLLPLPCGV